MFNFNLGSMPATSFGQYQGVGAPSGLGFLGQVNQTNAQAKAAEEANKLQRGIAQQNDATARWQAGLQAGVTREGNVLAADTARRGNELAYLGAVAPAQMQQNRFDRVLPWLQSQYNTGFDRVGGTNLPVRDTNVNQIYTPNWVNQTVNAAKATNEREAASTTRQAQQSAAGRGFGSNSPLLQALGVQAQMGAMQANSDAERDIRLTAGEKNRQQKFQNQQAHVTRDLALNDADIRRRQAMLQGQSSLLAALAGLV